MASDGETSQEIRNPEDVFTNLDSEPNKKRLSIERIYQRKTQLEHILLRPDTYVGSVEETKEPMFVYDEDKAAIIKRMVTFVPGLYKIFDEILVNAADNKQRDKNMTSLKVVINQEENLISVWNNGRGIPVQMHAVEKMYVPELIFGTLLTSSNFNDSQRKVTGGRNGYGAKLCNIFSSQFTVETSCSESKKMFKMTWTENMGKSGKTIVKDSKGSDYTKVTFKPDLAKFGMTHLTEDMVAIMTRRVYDMAGCCKGVGVSLNGKKISLRSFKDYVELYVKGVPPPEEEDAVLPSKVVHEVVNPRWEVAITVSNAGSFQQASFVNSIATTKGGTHVAYIVDQVVSKLLESAKKKNKGGMDLKPQHIKSHLWVFVNCLVENPTFDSQTKENMTLKAKSFGSACSLSDKFIKAATSCGIVDRVLNWARAKSQAQIAKKQSGSKHSKLRGIAKLDDANEAGGRNSLDCTLIVTEGDSAKTLAVSGLGIVGRDNYGVFPLRGKLLNVREATHNQIMGNEEIKNMVKILGLQYNKKYADSAELKTLRYGHLMIMADQDQDGSHIKGLIINFIHCNWPRLLRHNFLEEFITPIVKVSKSKQERAFFSLPEFENWKAQTANSQTWKVKYYKGLGTSTGKEAKEYFSDMEKHRVPFKYSGAEDDSAIELAFSKKLADRRKEWLTAWLQEKKDKRQMGMNESYLYGEETSSLSYADFVNKELILFSNADNERSIPSMVDGLKPGQRKVLFTCFKRNDRREVKVAQLAGSVAELSAYHHGEASLMSTIINLAQDFVGSNNVNLLQPIGQFGTRLNGGKDAASPRYIFTMLSPLSRLLFPSDDDPQLSYMREDNTRIEPEWYCPILPLVLVNGSEGIGTGYSTFVPNYDVREVVANIRRLMNDLEPVQMNPCYKNFAGAIVHVEPNKYASYGNVARLSPTSLEITELPIRTWTQSFKENVLEVMLHGNEKMQPFISDYKEYHTDTTVRFVVNMSQDKMQTADEAGFHKKFKLEGSITTSNMVLFDSDGCLKRYSSSEEILKAFYTVRLGIYVKRKDYLLGMLTAESAKLTNQARFIMEIIENKLDIKNKRKVDTISHLKARGYRSDPVKAWKAGLDSSHEDRSEEAGQQGEEEEVAEESEDYNYLLSMSMWSLTKEKKDELLKNRDAKVEELKILEGKTPKDLWTEDLDKFMAELDRVEEAERIEAAAGSKIAIKKTKAGKGKSFGRQTKLPVTGQNSLKHTKPSPFAETIAPVVPEFNANPKKTSTTRLKKGSKDEGSKDEGSKGEGSKGEGSKDEGSKGEGSIAEESESAKKVVKVPAKRMGAAKAIKEIFNISDDDSDVDLADDDDDDDFMSLPKRLKMAPTKAAKKGGVAKGAVVVKRLTVKAPAGKGQSTLKVASGSPEEHGKKRGVALREEEEEEDEEEEYLPVIKRAALTPQKKKTAAKSLTVKAAAGKGQSTLKVASGSPEDHGKKRGVAWGEEEEDEEEDEEDYMPATKKAAPKKKTAKAPPKKAGTTKPKTLVAAKPKTVVAAKPKTVVAAKPKVAAAKPKAAAAKPKAAAAAKPKAPAAKPKAKKPNFDDFDDDEEEEEEDSDSDIVEFGVIKTVQTKANTKRTVPKIADSDEEIGDYDSDISEWSGELEASRQEEKTSTIRRPARKKTKVNYFDDDGDDEDAVSYSD